MKLIFFLFLFILFNPLFSQEINKDEFYPQLKKTDNRSVNFEKCVSGNCRSGEGVYMTVNTHTSGNLGGKPYRKSTIYIYRGTFYKNGLKLIGKEYGLTVTYNYKKSKSKIMTPSYTNLMDGSDASFESKYLNYQGEFKFNKQKYLRNGKKGVMHFLLGQNENIKTYDCDYYNGYKNKRYITYTDNYKYKSYEGWIQPGERKTVGKLVLANGDVYEGTFFNEKYEGIGRLTTVLGVKEGYWKEGVLVKEEKLVLPKEAFTGNMDFSERSWLNMNLYETDKKGNYFGDSTEKIPNGQGLFFNYWGNTAVGNFTNGKLNGYAYRLTTKAQVKYHSSNHYPHIKEIGVFKDGVLVDGERISYRLESSKGSSYKYFVKDTKKITPSLAVTSQNASVTEVAIVSNDIDKQYQQAKDLMNKQEYSKALFILEKIIPQRGYDNQIPMQAAFCYLMLKDINKAEKYIQQAIIINQTDFTGYLVDSYIKTAKNEMDAAKVAMDDAMWFDPNTNQKIFTANLEAMAKAGLNSAGCEEMLSYIKSKYYTRDKSYKVIDEFMNKGVQQVAKNPSLAKTYFNKGIKNCEAVGKKPWLKAFAYYVASVNFYYKNKYNEAKEYIDLAYIENEKYKLSLSIYPQVFTNVVLAEYAYNEGNVEKALSFLSDINSKINLLGAFANDFKAKFYERQALIYLSENDIGLLKNSANSLLALSNTGFDDYYNAEAYSFLGAAYGNTVDVKSRKESRAYYEKAFKIADKNNFEPLRSDVQSNLALAYWQSGDKNKARSTYQEVIQRDRSKKNYKNAEVSLNNLAFMHIYDKDYVNAALYFKQATVLTEEARLNLSEENKVTFFEGKISAYKGLIYALAKQGKVAEVFETQQQDRARVLIENLNKDNSYKPVSLSEFQASLALDEVAVFYSLFEAGEVTITTVSNTSAQVQVIDQKENFLNMKGRYLDLVYKGKPGYNAINVSQAKKYANLEDKIASQLSMGDFDKLMELLRGVIDKSIKTPNEKVRTDIIAVLMNQYYKFLIQPIESKLNSKKDVILFPDGILNFLPFEALRTSNGEHFVKNYDIRYGRSADVSLVLRNRIYDDNRRTFLAMGGATYGRMNEHDKIDEKQVRYTSLKLKATKNAKQGKSQREIYASLFGEKMNYLPGTLKEVNNLSQIFSNPSVYRGSEMTENRIKTLSRTKELQNYKIIHLATHGFSIPEFPELSGIAMCIFPEAQNGEDGYLTVTEITQLNMKADLVVLSACDTALGKIYGGEGVAGLTQSVLEGGANAAMVSLWPVNDAGTMCFMTGLYQLTEKEGKTYVEAVNIMKRKFISGEFGEAFKDPQIWAPFIHYGY